MFRKESVCYICNQEFWDKGVESQLKRGIAYCLTMQPMQPVTQLAQPGSPQASQAVSVKTCHVLVYLPHEYIQVQLGHHFHVQFRFLFHDDDFILMFFSPNSVSH